MSAKIAICLGDYSNGWNDAAIAQGVLPFKQAEAFKNGRHVINEILARHLNAIMDELESNPVVNPIPNDEPCCDKFQEWSSRYKELDKTDDLVCCPFCGKKITLERRKKWFTNF
jgi:hypothetical protein